MSDGDTIHGDELMSKEKPVRLCTFSSTGTKPGIDQSFCFDL